MSPGLPGIRTPLNAAASAANERELELLRLIAQRDREAFR